MRIHGMVSQYLSTLLVLTMIISASPQEGNATSRPSATSFNPLNGNWHLRVMDGMDVRKARAIVDLDLDAMKLSGFDACNRMHGNLVVHSETNTSVPMLITTRMACREPIHTWVSLRLQETLKEGFTIKEETKYGLKGIILKSPKHELFLKRMGR
jgi:heat shock protein HslJ